MRVIHPQHKFTSLRQEAFLLLSRLKTHQSFVLIKQLKIGLDQRESNLLQRINVDCF